MNSKHLQDAIGNIDDQYIEEAAEPAKLPFPTKIWMPAAALAACVLLTVSLLPWKTMFSGNGSSVKDPVGTDSGVNILQNDDTTYLDTTKENEDSSITEPHEDTQSGAEENTYENTQTILPIPDTIAPIPNTAPHPDTEDPVPNTKPTPDTVDPTPNTTPTPDTVGPTQNNKPVPDTTGPTQSIKPPPDTVGPILNDKPVPDTTGPTQSINPTPDTTGPVQNIKPAPDTTGQNQNSTLPPHTTGPYPDVTDGPDTGDTTASEKETTAPTIPNDPIDPTPVVPLPQYPTILSRSQYPVQDQYPHEISLLPQWRNAKSARVSYYQSGIGDTDSFMYWTVREFFSNSVSDNLVYSPANAYMTLGMLAETAGGNTQSQLLRLLGENDVLSLRSSAKNLWNSCYRDDGIVTTVLGNSMWLDDSLVLKAGIPDILAENYYTSSFYGNMGRVV